MTGWHDGEIITGTVQYRPSLVAEMGQQKNTVTFGWAESNETQQKDYFVVLYNFQLLDLIVKEWFLIERCHWKYKLKEIKSVPYVAILAATAETAVAAVVITHTTFPRLRHLMQSFSEHLVDPVKWNIMFNVKYWWRYVQNS